MLAPKLTHTKPPMPGSRHEQGACVPKGLCFIGARDPFTPPPFSGYSSLKYRLSSVNGGVGDRDIRLAYIFQNNVYTPFRLKAHPPNTHI